MSVPENEGVKMEAQPKCPVTGCFGEIRTFLRDNEHLKEAGSHFRSSVVEVLKGFQSIIQAEIDWVQRAPRRKDSFRKIEVKQG